MENITFELNGKKYKLPEVLRFGLFDYYFYFAVGFHCPKKGEYFVSGAKPQAYEAPNDLSTEYLIVEKLTRAKRKQVWVAVPE